jgi:hypothetical protein
VRIEQTGEATSEAARALAQARSAGMRVEVLGERSETEQLFANPDGSFTSEQHATPVRVRRGSGWVPIDTTLQRQPDATVAPVAVAVKVAFSGGGSGPLVEAGNGDKAVTLTWPASLPEPELAGDTATYRGVRPGVDLWLRATATGFASGLLVREPATAATLATVQFGLSRRGFADTEPVLGSASPMMWDSKQGKAVGVGRGGRRPADAQTRAEQRA